MYVVIILPFRWFPFHVHNRSKLTAASAYTTGYFFPVVPVLIHSPMPTVTGTTGTFVADAYKRFLIGSVSQVFRGAYRQYLSYFAHLSNACQIILSNLLLRLPVPRSCTARCHHGNGPCCTPRNLPPRSSGRHRTSRSWRHRLLGSFPVHG